MLDLFRLRSVTSCENFAALLVASSLVRGKDPSALAPNSTTGPYLPETFSPAFSEMSSLIVWLASR